MVATIANASVAMAVYLVRLAQLASPNDWLSDTAKRAGRFSSLHLCIVVVIILPIDTSLPQIDAPIYLFSLSTDELNI